MTRVERTALVVLVAAGLALAAGCKKRKQCPFGMQLERATEVGIWCMQPGGNDALYVMYHPGTNQPRMYCRYAGGALSGTFESFHANGKTQVKGQYRAGRKHGVWVQTDEFGGKLADGEYREGALVAGAPVGNASLCESVHRP